MFFSEKETDKEGAFFHLQSCSSLWCSSSIASPGVTARGNTSSLADQSGIFSADCSPVAKRAIPVIPAIALNRISRISKTRFGSHHWMSSSVPPADQARRHGIAQAKIQCFCDSLEKAGTASRLQQISQPANP